MTSIREKLTYNKSAKIVLWVILFSMAGGSLLFTPNLFKNLTRSGSDILIIDGHSITKKDLSLKTNLELERLARLRQQLGKYADSYLQSIKSPEVIALQSLMVESLLNSVADKISVKIAPEFVLQKLQDPEFVVRNFRDIIPLQSITQQGGINMPFLRSYLQRQGLSLGDFEASIERSLRRKLVGDLIKSSVYISEQEIKNFIIQRYGERSYYVVKLSLDDAINDLKKGVLDRQGLEAFFKERNKIEKKYWIPERRNGTLWKFLPQDYGVVVDMDEAKRFYDKNKRQFIDSPLMLQVRRILFKVDQNNTVNEVYKKAQKILSELKENPTSFAQKAEEFSDDSTTAKNGGLLDYFKRGDLDGNFEKAAFRLQADGDISDIISTSRGLEIIQRVARKSPTYKPFDSVKNEIVEQIKKSKFLDQFPKDAQKVVRERQNADQSLKKFLSKKKHLMTSIENIEKTDSIDSQALFKAKIDDYGYFIGEDGSGNIFMISEIKKSHEPSLEEVIGPVTDDFYTEKATKSLKDDIALLKKDAQKKGLGALSGSTKYPIQEINFIKKNDVDRLEELSRKGIPVESLLSMTQEGDIADFVADGSGYLMQLKELNPIDNGVFVDKRQEALAAIVEDKKELVYRGYIASLLRNATIKPVDEKEVNQETLPLEEVPYDE